MYIRLARPHRDQTHTFSTHAIPTFLTPTPSIPADLAPTYEAVCAELGWTVDAAKLEAMQAVNATDLAALEVTIADAEENMGDIETRDARLAKADYLCKLGSLS